MKKCNKCKAWKTPSEFHKSNANKDGLCYACKACANAIKKVWKAANSARALASQLEWQRTHAEHVWLTDHRHRARKKGNEVCVVTVKEIKRLKAQPCYLCGVAPSDTVDHVIPLVKGGRHAIGNFLGVCHDCNRKKNAKYLIKYRRELLGGAIDVVISAA